jgi:RND family efflux transporter MFP subunit
MKVAHTAGKLVTLVLAALALPALGCNDKNPAPVPTGAPVVQVAVPLQRIVTDYNVFIARTQAVNSVDVKPRVTGYLTKICFKDGVVVDENQVLFEIDDRPYKAALDRSKAELKYRKAALVEAQAFYDIGVAVQKQEKGAISQQEITKRFGARDEAAAAIEVAEATLYNAQLNYDWCKVAVNPPLKGRISRHLVDEGNLVTADQTVLANVVSLDPMWAYFPVDENSAQEYQEKIMQGKLKSARDTKVDVEMALGLSTDFGFKGYIDYVGNQFDPNTGSLTVRATIPNKDGKLYAGEFGRVRVPMSEPHKALLVADSAIGFEQGQRYVLVVNDQNVVEQRGVEVGQLHGGFREVRRYRAITEVNAQGQNAAREIEVLRPTDRLVVNGLQRVRPGITVDPRVVDMALLVAGQDSDTRPNVSPPAKAPAAAKEKK